ncbi:hypothetical protein IKE72_00995 [Candidatus Saccharibacteria bacterium]|nr:hypothetical protein [Candidatus Saccharibacteria bacterium]
MKKKASEKNSNHANSTQQKDKQSVAHQSSTKFDRAIKKAEKLTGTIEIIMRNRLIIAFFLIIDGVTFLLNPEMSLPGMAQNIILIVIFASLTILITNLAAKTKDYKTIFISLAILAVSGFLYFYPDLIAAYIQLFLALFIIYDGIKNIAETLHLTRLTDYTAKVARKYNKFAHTEPKSEKEKIKREKFKEIDTNLDTSLTEQKDKLMSPLRNLVGKSSKSSRLYVAVNIITIILGLVVLFYPSASMAVWGLIFLYTGLTNFTAALHGMDIKNKLKQKRFREILYDAEGNEKKEKPNS